MKRLFTILLLAAGICSTDAQSKFDDAAYFSGDINFGRLIGVDLNLNYILNEKMVFRAGYSNSSRIARTLPDDYEAGLIGLFSLGLNTPHDFMQNIQFEVGWVWNLSEKGTARFNASAGLAWTLIERPFNWQKVDAFMGANYTWDYEYLHRISLVVHPRFEFPLIRYFGLSINPMLQTNRDMTFFGVGVGVMFGLLKKGTQTGQDQSEASAE